MARRRSTGITGLRFNQDQDCFTCCLKTGLRVYNVEPLYEKAHYSKEELGEVSLCEMVFRTNWLLIVRARSPKNLMLLDDQQRAIRAVVPFPRDVEALCARKEKVVVAVQSDIVVMSLPGLVYMSQIPIGSNRPVTCAIATNPEVPHLLAAPAHRKGSVQLLDITHVVNGAQSSSPVVIGCHNTDLVCISLSVDGTRLATASERGTIIRLWDTITKNILHDLRRGSDYADVFCLKFNKTASLLSCVSDKGTMHLWATTDMPTWRAGDHLAAVRFSSSSRSACAFLVDDAGIVVICEDGTFHKFTLPAERTCRHLGCENFLQVGDDDEFLQ